VLDLSVEMVGKHTVKIFFFVVLLLIFFPYQSAGMVTGPCGNCHTMHNSQNGLEVIGRGDSAFTASEAKKNLLVNNCLGCHSSTSSSTIINLGDTRVPIVYNMAEPANPLAGGNFYWVETLGDEYGHNVMTVDGTLDWAPGGDTSFGVIPNNCGFEGCHKSLASIRYGGGPGPLLNPIVGNGCIGCHDAAHHADDRQHPLAGGYKYVNEAGGGYRFLNKAGAKYWNIPPHNPPAVAGIEDPDWQQNPSSTSHNEYQDSPKPGAPGNYGGKSQGISDFCGGCHNSYHSWTDGGYPNGGDGNPWLRHPASIVLPDSGEYANYTVYNPNVPVARSDAAVLSGYSGPSGAVTPGSDKVMCLSCHRAHGSPYKDMLRWDSDAMVANGGGSGGCFVCHSTKN
jgi:predicted CXXCH cytochrome family protein